MRWDGTGGRRPPNATRRSSRRRLRARRARRINVAWVCARTFRRGARAVAFDIGSVRGTVLEELGDTGTRVDLHDDASKSRVESGDLCGTYVRVRRRLDRPKRGSGRCVVAEKVRGVGLNVGTAISATCTPNSMRPTGFGTPKHPGRGGGRRAEFEMRERRWDGGKRKGAGLPRHFRS